MSNNLTKREIVQKIYESTDYNHKDVMRKDSSAGNTNHYSQMLFWCLEDLALEE